MTTPMTRTLCLTLLLLPLLAAASTPVEVATPLPALTYKDTQTGVTPGVPT